MNKSFWYLLKITFIKSVFLKNDDGEGKLNVKVGEKRTIKNPIWISNKKN